MKTYGFVPPPFIHSLIVVEIVIVIKLDLFVQLSTPFGAVNNNNNNYDNVYGAVIMT